MFFRPIISRFKRLKSLWFKRMKRVAAPFTPRLDPLEDRRLMAANLFAISSPTGAPPLVKFLDRNYRLIFPFTWACEMA